MKKSKSTINGKTLPEVSESISKKQCKQTDFSRETDSTSFRALCSPASMLQNSSDKKPWRTTVLMCWNRFINWLF